MNERRGRSVGLSPVDPSEARIDELWRRRPRDRFLRWSLAGAAAFGVLSFWIGDFSFGDAFSERRMDNLSRFLGEIRPFPLQGRSFDLAVFGSWLRDRLVDPGWEAAMATLAISVVAIALAALLGLVAAPFAARNVMHPQPFVAGGRSPSHARRRLYRAVVAATRGALIFLRSLPEYVWAFFFVAMLGPSAWPAILALAIHNAGILGRLSAETIENVPARVPAALAGLGARRRQILAFGVFPDVLPRLLLYFFYRWETCVREATVLGLLGIVSLGYWIADARARGQYDNFVLLILLGSVLVLAGDLLSALLRRIVRRA